MRNIRKIAVFIVLGAIGCNFNHKKMTTDLTDLGKVSCEPVLFSTIKQNIFVSSNCSDCHGVQFDSYDKIKTQADALKIWLPKMPKKNPQTAATLALFDRWVAQGFPQTAEQANLSSCDVLIPKPPPNSNTGDTEPNPPSIVCNNSYRDIADNVLTPRCIGCHGIKGDVNLESYAEVKSNLKLIQSEVEGDTMPPKSPLTLEQKDKLLTWIASGAPENSTDPNCQNLPPVVTVLEPTFKSLNEKVFMSRCTVCHNSSMTNSKKNLEHGQNQNSEQEDGGFDFSTYEKMKSYGAELFNFNKPEKSKIVRVVVKGVMPPPSTNFKPLTAEELDVLTQWIKLGLPKE